MKTSEPIAPLREDLQWLERDDGTIDVRDPHLLQVFSLPADEVELARRFDGKANAKQIAKRARTDVDLGAKDVLRLAEEFIELDLLERPEVWDKDPVVENSTPYTLIQVSTKKLKVLPEGEPHARWSCGACGACCHGLAVEVSAEEESRIDASLYEDILGEDGFVMESFIDPDRGPVRILRQRSKKGNACVFLQDNGLCAVHARQGMEAKPDACQIFPNMVIHVPKGAPRLAMRTNCRTMHDSFETGQPVEEHRAHVLRLLETSGAYKLPKKVPVFEEEVSFAKADAIRIQINAILDAEGVTAAALAKIDAELLGGRAKKARKRFGKRLLAYLCKEIDAELPIEQGALAPYFTSFKRWRKALEAMQEGKAPPALPDDKQRFLRAQIKNVLYAGGAMTFPDAGYGYAAIILAIEGTMHSIGKKGEMKTVNDAFIAFTTPIIETTAHAWPILAALNKGYAKRLKEEL